MLCCGLADYFISSAFSHKLWLRGRRGSEKIENKGYFSKMRPVNVTGRMELGGFFKFGLLNL